jgi:hypothetical protein
MINIFLVFSSKTHLSLSLDFKKKLKHKIPPTEIAQYYLANNGSSG